MKTNKLQGHLTRTSLALALLAPLTAAALGVSGSSIPAAFQEPLSEDTDAGAIVDREGVAARKAVMASRWGPADARTRIELGDWLKTGTRGANALALELAGGGDVLLGPGTLVEVVNGKRLRLSRGELRATGTEDAPLEVTGPGDTTIRVTERSVLRARDGKLVRLAEDPRWLTGYETNSSTEALGSLLANVDGRDLPLTIGYHKVTVDIRDQIARTVIEESFVNHTHTILEGVFYFPLPPGASISSFGMWINGELVQGDIVEKQRAREIYETILRERRDPGLLEWTGGNIFKARVFPIGAEKRIRLAYTQVLPKEGDTYVYNYALQSEMLRKTPLRKLQIEVNVASAEALESVRSPSHECRVRTSGNSAKVEFDAEEYSPDSDFELRVRTQSEGWKVSAVPHRRGDDGYFMLLIDTPELATERSVPDFEPLDVLVIADTSGSMWGPARPTQVDFVEALLGALSENDTLNLMTADSAARFAFERPRPADDTSREAALGFLEARRPLGWSDLDRAFAAAFEIAGPNTQVIYVGDGQPTTGDADPVALAHRLQRKWEGQGTFHAVVPGTRSEPAVLRALAGFGGGSVRSIGGGSDPAATAFALLREIASPAVKDLSLGFEGMSVAAVYPEVLPNLPLGGQQVVVGRFDPTLGDTNGRVTVTGVVNGEPVSFETEVALDVEDGAAADKGNSFVPRLWARHHLDHLLDQGSSKETRENIIALSEDFQVITPYTSFLVLESDADRERFNVQRQFRMRDGEEFFADGRESGRHELLKQQMLAAKTWRKRLRAEMLTSLARMNRELTELLRAGAAVRFQDAGALGLSSSIEWSQVADNRMRRLDMDGFGQSYDPSSGPADSVDEFFSEGEDDARFANADDKEGWADEPSLEAEEVMRDMPARSPAPASRPIESYERSLSKKSRSGFAGGKRSELAQQGILGGEYRYGGRGRYNQSYYYDPFAQLFPTVGPVRAEAPETSWPEEVVTLLSSLDRRTSISASDRGWALGVETEYHDLRGRVQTSSGTHFLARDRWAVRGAHLPGGNYSLQYLDAGKRGLISVGWNLGRVRDAEDGDASAWPAPFAWHFGDAVRSYAGYEARLEDGEDGRVLVILHTTQAPTNELILEIDRERAVVVEQRWTVDGEITRGLAFSDFKTVGGMWWPGQVRSWSKGRVDYSLTRIRAVDMDATTFDEQLALDLELRSDSILMGDDATDLAAAKQAAKDGDATLEQRWLLLRHFGGTQRWELAAPHLAAIETLVGDKPGLVPVRSTYLQQSRRNEELRQLLMEVARDLSAEPRDAEHGMATQLLGHTGGLNQGNELYALLEALEPLFARQTGILDGSLAWDQRMQQALQNVGRPEEAFARLEAMTTLYPYQVSIQTNFAHSLARHGELDRAMAFLAQVEEQGGPWQPYEVGQLRQTGAQLLWNGYRLKDFVALVENWEREDPTRLNSGILNQYLSALVFLDRETEAWERIETWLTEYRKPELDPVEQMRLQAAIQLALGNGHNLSHSRFEDDRSEMLADTARYLTGLADGQQYLAAQILQHYYFRQTDAARALLGELYARLEAEVAELSVQRVALLVGWLRGAGFTTDAGEDGWQSILDGIFERWLVAETDADRQALGQLVLSYGRRELVLRHHRHLLETAQGETATAAAAQRLFYALLGGPWDAEVQAELLGLLPRVAMTTAEGGGELDSDAEAASLRAHIVALYDLVGWLPTARAQAEVAALPDVNSMPRRLLASRRDAALRTSQTATAELLQGLATSLQREELRDWASIERAYLLVKTRADVREVRETSMRILNALSVAHIGAEEADEVPLRSRILAARCAATVAHLLAHYEDETRAQHEPAYLTLLDTGIEQGTVLVEWRELKYALLVALDRGDAIETELAKWFAGGEEFAKVRWGRDYAYVLAERSQLERATKVLKEIEGIDELGHEDYRALADWYTALDQADSAREMRIRSWEVQGENAIGQALSRDAGAYQRSGDDVPPELDPEVPLRFVALLRKATYPANWTWVLQSYYSSTKDFRLLECLPEAVIGQSSQKIYPFLSNMAGIASQIYEEATVDRLREHLAAMSSTRAKTDVDRRALALLEFAIVRQATMQANGTEDHAAIALAALKKAFRGKWEEGEPTMMAEFLANQGNLKPESLAREQLRQMRQLLRIVEHSQDRYVIQGRLADLFWSYGRRDDAIRTLESALDSYRAAHDGLLPQSANNRLTGLTSWMQGVGSYRAAEKIWLREMGQDHHQDQRLWLEQRLFELYRNALLAHAEVSLGSELELYAAVHDRMLAALEVQTNEQHAYQLVNTLCDLWNRSHKHLKYTRISRDVVRFAYGVLPQVLDRYQYRNGQSMVGTMSDTLANVRDERTALDFLAGRAENEPRWLRLRNQDFWSQHAWRMAHLRRKVGRLDAGLKERVLAIVTHELMEDLRTRQARNRNIYDIRNSDFWSEQRTSFLATALASLEEHSDSGVAVTYTTEYLFRGLNAHELAIDGLFRAYAKDLLDIGGRAQLAVFLQETRRWAESLPVLTALIDEQPSAVQYRVMLMRGHFGNDNPEAVVRSLDAAVAWYREHDAWTEAPIAALAEACLETRLMEQSVGLFDEAIALHVKSAPNRGVGDGVLAPYYRKLAGAHAGLGNTDKAVDAAAGAIISWGRSTYERGHELAQLEQVLFDSRDLDAYVTRFDGECAENGLENPIVRKALGKVYARKKAFPKAAAQLRLALLAQPNDMETHQMLVTACDGMRRPDLAAEAVLEWARAEGHRPALYRQLGDLWTKLERADDAERAYTNLVEVSPNESEFQASLAEVRQNQNRWEDALPHWRHVVRIRTNEPAGYFGLARALIRLRHWDEAREVVDEIMAKDWPERFGDVHETGRGLIRDIPRSR